MLGLLSSHAPEAGSKTMKVSAAFTFSDMASASITTAMIFFVSSNCLIVMNGF